MYEAFNQECYFNHAERPNADVLFAGGFGLRRTKAVYVQFEEGSLARS